MGYSEFLRGLALACLSASTIAVHAAVPANERAALLALYNSTNGPGWTNHSGWGGPIGTECSWHGVSCNAAKTTVIQISLDDNNLTGTLPSALASLKHLSGFLARTNKLSGPIPPLTGLTELSRFWVRQNKLTGQIPSLSGLKNLFDVDVSYNQLTGQIPALAGLSVLSYFRAYGNYLSGSIPSLSTLVNLREFEVMGNGLTGAIPSVAGLSKLSVFRVDNNRLSGPIPSLAGLTALSDFVAHTNQLSGPIPPLTGLTGLEYFSVERNLLTGGIPALSGLTNLKEFTAWENDLTGAIPGLAWLAKLERFEVANNALSGPIPSLSGMTNLQYFDASYNELSGSIPVLDGLDNLEYFQVFDNHLSGSLPDISGLPKLAWFVAGFNWLTGAIPALDSAVNLTYYDVQGNRLSGTIPSLSALSKLQTFRVNHNRLSGNLPPAPTGVGPYYAVLCPNFLEPVADAAWDAATQEAPWYTECVSATERTIPYAYVANSGSGTVSVVDTNQDAVVAQIPVGGVPWGVAVGPGGDRIYVANAKSGTVSVIDGQSKSVTATLSVGSKPMGIAVSEDGKHVMVANSDSGTVTLIDAEALLVTGTVAVGSYPEGVSFMSEYGTFSADDGYFVVTLRGCGCVVPVQRNLQVGKPYAVGPSPTAVASAWPYFYVADANVGTLASVNTFNAFGWFPPQYSLIGGSLSGLAFTRNSPKFPAGILLLSNSAANNVSVVAPPPQSFMKYADVHVGTQPMGVAVTPNGHKAYVANFGSGSVSVIDFKTLQVATTIAVQKNPASPGLFIRSAEDYVPDPFAFSPEVGVNWSTYLKANVVQSMFERLDGFDQETPVSISCPANDTACGYSINGRSWTKDPSLAKPGSWISVQQTAAMTSGTTTQATVVVGGRAATFSVTTKGPVKGSFKAGGG